MTVLVVLAAWLGLGCLTWALFAAVVRGAGTADAELEPRPHVNLPSQRDSQQDEARAAVTTWS